MLAQASFLSNHAEIQTAKEKGLPSPEERYDYDEFLFALKDVSCAHRANTGQVIIYIDGWKWILEYNEELWARIKAYLNSK